MKKVIEDILENGSVEDLYVATTFNENQLYWMSYIMESIEKRRMAALLVSNGYSLEDIDKLLFLSDSEKQLMKDHIDKYKTIGVNAIVHSIIETFSFRVMQSMMEKMLSKGISPDKIATLLKLFILDHPYIDSSDIEKRPKDMTSSQDESQLEGIKIGKLITAHNLLKEGMDIQFVSLVTELSKDEIENPAE